MFLDLIVYQSCVEFVDLREISRNVFKIVLRWFDRGRICRFMADVSGDRFKIGEYFTG